MDWGSFYVLNYRKCSLETVKKILKIWIRYLRVRFYLISYSLYYLVCFFLFF